MNTQAKAHVAAHEPYWHEANPWAATLVYVPLSDLAVALGDGRQIMDMAGPTPQQKLYTPEYLLAKWHAYGDRLDAYVLPQTNGQHSAGIRYGAEGSEYLSPWIEPAKAAELLERYADHPAPAAPRPAPDHGRENALAWFASIVEMVDTWRKASHDDRDYSKKTGHYFEDDMEEARTRIHESVLSVEVRNDWYALGDPHGNLGPVEFCILLSTGGPALRLVGDLSEHGEPESARLEGQNWGTPWTEIGIGDLAERLTGNRYDKMGIDDMVKAGDAVREYLLDFARQFYFGE